MLHFATIIVNLRISSRFLGGTRDKRGRFLVRETFFLFARFRYDEIGRKALFLTFLRNDCFLTKQKIKIKKIATKTLHETPGESLPCRCHWFEKHPIFQSVRLVHLLKVRLRKKKLTSALEPRY